MGNFYIIRWGDDANDNYNYGAEIQYESNGLIHYSSPFMQVGGTIKSWHSTTKFHADRKSPMLPLLANGNRYNISVHADFENQVTVQMEIEFFSSNEALIEKKFFKTLNEEFTYPDDATSYRIHLINKNHNRFIFHFLSISEAELAQTYQVETNPASTVISFKRKSENLNSKNQIVLLRGMKNMFCATIPDDSELTYIYILVDDLIIDSLSHLYKKTIEMNNDARFDVTKGMNYQSLGILGEVTQQALQNLLPQENSSQISNEKSNEEIIAIKWKSSQMVWEILTKLILEGEYE